VAFARGGSESERKAVEAIVDAYIKTINDGDLELVGKIWSHDERASFIGPQGRFSGYEEVRDKLVMSFKNGFAKRNLRKDELIIVIEGKSAWAEFTWTFDSVGKDGTERTSRGRETQIFRKEKDGWKLMHIHYSGIRSNN
jgi:ketosteroid isomerase-like protein